MLLLVGCGDDGGDSPDDGSDGGQDSEQDAGLEGRPDGAVVEVSIAELDFSDFDDAVERFMDTEGLPGLSAAVVHRELGVVHLRGYGAFEADRLYALASSSKILTAGIVMRLHDQGVVDVDAPIGDFVGDLWAEGKSELTLAQLLSNSSGLTSLSDDALYAPYLCQYVNSGMLETCAETIYSADDAADRIAPDTTFKYGGGQWQLAGGVAAVASGKSWAELVAETYVEPCGVPSVGFSNPFGAGSGYPAYLQGDPANVMPSDNPNMEGGAYANAGDYAALLLMHLRGGQCDDGRVLSEASVARMQVDRIGEVYEGTTFNPNLQGYGLGWWVDREQEGVVVDGGAWGAMPWLDTARGYGAFLVMEAEARLGERLRLETQPLLEAVFDAYEAER